MEDKCKICKHIIYKKGIEFEKEGYSDQETESITFEELEENSDGFYY